MVTLDSTVWWGILMVTLDSTMGGGGGDSHGYFRQHCLLEEFSWLL